jgi:hypothetical protein
LIYLDDEPIRASLQRSIDGTLPFRYCTVFGEGRYEAGTYIALEFVEGGMVKLRRSVGSRRSGTFDCIIAEFTAVVFE